MDSAIMLPLSQLARERGISPKTLQMAAIRGRIEGARQVYGRWTATAAAVDAYVASANKWLESRGRRPIDNSEE